MSGLSEKSLVVFDDEASALQKRELDLEAPVPRGHSIVDGVITLIEYVLQADDVPFSFDPSLREEVAEFEEDAREDARECLADVLRVYQDLAGLYPDVLGVAYGGTPDDFFELRREIVPDLLDGVARWAHDRGDEELARQLERTENKWTEALRGLSRRRSA